MADGAKDVPSSTSSNRYYSQFSNDTNSWLGIDFCCFTIDFPLFLKESGHDNNRDLIEFLDLPEFAHDACSLIHAFFFEKNILLSSETGKGRFYKNRVSLNDINGRYVGMIEIGGNETARKNGSCTARIEITGAGCEIFEQSGEAMPDHAKRWLELRAKLESVDGRLSRLDIAYDDFKGSNTVSQALTMWKEGAFDQRGQHPKAQHLDDLGSGAGSTAYIGSRSSEKFMRVYEKGKQLGDIQSQWTRWEVQFNSSTRKSIDLDILRDPAAYFRGAYPVLQFIRAVMLRFEASGIKDVSSMKSCFRHLKKQYGASLNFLSHYFSDDEKLGKFIVNLTRPALPEWGFQILQGKSSIPSLHQ